MEGRNHIPSLRKQHEGQCHVKSIEACPPLNVSMEVTKNKGRIDKQKTKAGDAVLLLDETFQACCNIVEKKFLRPEKASIML